MRNVKIIKITPNDFNEWLDFYRLNNAQIFKRMLERGHPSDNWEELLQEAKSEINRLEKVVNIEI